MSLDIPSIVSDLKRHWWNILLASIAGAMLVYVAFAVLPLEKYSTSTVFVVVSNTSDVVSSTSSVYNANTIASALTSVLNADVLTNLVQAELGEISYEAEATYTSNANLITLVVTTGDPQSAFLVTKSILTNYPALIDNVMTDVRLITLMQPEIPEQPDVVYPVSILLVLGFCGAGMAYAVAVSLLSILRDTVKNEQDVRNKVDTLHIGTIPYLVQKRGEAIGVFSHAQNSAQLARKYELAAMRIAGHMSRYQQKVLMVTSVMPNEGKTTSAVQLAIALGKSQKKVLLIDGDFRNPTMGDMLRIQSAGKATLAQALASTQYRAEDWYHVTGMSVYCLAGEAGQDLSGSYINNGRFAQLLDFARTAFDYIIIDTGPTAFVSDTELLAQLCDAVVLIVGQDITLARAINDTVDLFEKENQLVGCIFKEGRVNKTRYHA